VKRRTLAVDGRYIRGYGVPKYGTETKETTKAPTEAKKQPSADSKEYPLTQFIKDIQKATGAKIDGIAGTETLSKTVTVSAKKNSSHAVVRPLQKRLNALGFNCGVVDGAAGKKFTAAVIAYQKAKGCVQDGEITARHRTWQHLLEII
jgi:peptidoglycan hydrolase-like protein with peptidoglycan-binding domain